MLRLSQRMEEILLMTCRGNVKSSEIAETLGISRQAVSKTLREARAKLTEIFLRISEILNSDIIRININRGFIVLRNRQTGNKIYVLYIPNTGPLILFSDKPNCLKANVHFCKEIIKAAIEWGLISEETTMDNLDQVIKEIIKRMEE